MISETILRYLGMAAAFIAALLFVFGAAQIRASSASRRRFEQLSRTSLPRTGKASASDDGEKEGSWLSGLTQRLSALSKPKESTTNDAGIDLKFVRAGLRDPSQVNRFHVLKSALAIGLPLLTYFFSLTSTSISTTNELYLYVVLAAAIGYYLPEIYLRNKTATRQKQVRNGLPDMLDLLVICTESGLGLDSAMQRVSREMSRSSPILADELLLTTLEIRAGSGRDVAFRHLNERVNLEDIQSLVSILSQADRFGSSIAESLRILSDIMRVKRMQRAEELAAKVPTKMLLPLAAFIFPAMLIVIVGPGVIKLMEAFVK